MMGTEIKCPNCGHQFELYESLKNEVEKELRSKMLDWQKKKEEEFEKQRTAPNWATRSLLTPTRGPMPVSSFGACAPPRSLPPSSRTSSGSTEVERPAEFMGI